MTKYYADGAGNYLGGWSMSVDGQDNEPDHPDVPAGATEIPVAPDDARQIWDGAKWGAAPPPMKTRGETVADTLDAAIDDPARWAAVANWLRMA